MQADHIRAWEITKKMRLVSVFLCIHAIHAASDGNDESVCAESSRDMGLILDLATSHMR